MCILPVMGNNLKLLRLSKGWTLEAAAEAFAMSRGGYIKIERGERLLKQTHIEQAKRIYDISAEQVLGDIDNDDLLETIRQALENLDRPLTDSEQQFVQRVVADALDWIRQPHSGRNGDNRDNEPQPSS